MTAIIVLNWNGAADTVACLESLFKISSPAYRWVVVDNHSEDNSLQEIGACLNRCKKKFIRVTEENEDFSISAQGAELHDNPDGGILLSLSQNYGFSKGNNLGIACMEKICAQTAVPAPSHYFLLNNDTTVEADFLQKLEDFAARHPQYAALTPQIRYYAQPDKIWNCGGKFFFGLRKYYYPQQSVSRLPSCEFLPAGFISGCALFASRGLLYKENNREVLLSEKFFFGEEDFEFALRMREQKFPMACVLDSVIYHKVGSSRKIDATALQSYLCCLGRFIALKRHWSALKFFIWKRLYFPYLRLLLKKTGVGPGPRSTFIKRLKKESCELDGVDSGYFKSASLQRVLLIGYLGEKSGKKDGQTVKTAQTLRLLKENLPSRAVVETFDTEILHSRPCKAFSLLRKLYYATDVVYMPAHNNLKRFLPKLVRLRSRFKFRIIYVLIGGWLPDFLRQNPSLVNPLKKVDVVLPENQLVCSALQQDFGLTQVEILPNFRFMETQREVPEFQQTGKEFRLVFMSRITQMKGIATAFNVVKQAPFPLRLDFYGPVSPEDKTCFEQLLSQVPHTAYKGVLEPERVCKVLSGYDAMIFPTRHITEGLPGAIIEAYAAGLPVLASDWNYAKEYVLNGQTGYIIPKGEKEEALYLHYMNRWIQNPALFLEMKKAAYNQAQAYSAPRTWQILKKYL